MFSRALNRVSGVTLPMFTGRFDVPLALLLPVPTEVHVRWGSPVSVGPPDAEPSDERVEQIFTNYLEELQGLFDKHAPLLLPADVAARGLEIVRLDGKPVPVLASRIRSKL